MRHWLKSLLAVVALIAPAAMAEPDSFGLGTGRDGPLNVTTSNTVVNAYTNLTAATTEGSTQLAVSSVSGFAAGELVMVLQVAGLTPAPGSGDGTPIDLTNGGVGRWEFARLAAVDGAALTFTLTAPLVYAYPSQGTQVIRVPEYTNVNIPSGTDIKPRLWNGTTGGVVAFLATGTISIDGVIEVGAWGLRGGIYAVDNPTNTGCTGLDEPAPRGGVKGEGIVSGIFNVATGRGNVANGGGGGICSTSGGGGGGNGGAGGKGGRTSNLDGSRDEGGLGGARLVYPALQRLTFGGGGGAGHGSSGTGGPGGRGGGIVFIRANALTGAGQIRASGGPGANTSTDGASGGGAGGTIYLRIAGTAACGGIVASGGAGGNSDGAPGYVGPGGGGGGGRVLFQASSVTICPITVNAGLAGTELNSPPQDPHYGAEPTATNAPNHAGVVTILPGGFTVPAVPTVVTPANDSFTNDPRPVVSGTASPNVTVIVYVDGVQDTLTTADASGNWSATVGKNLTAGGHAVRAVAEYQAVRSALSAANSFTVDFTPPVAPVVVAPANGARTNDTTPDFSGTAEAGATVRVYLDNSLIGQTTASGTGSWILPAPNALTERAYGVHATATDAAGNTSVASSTNTFTVDLTPPLAPTVSSPTDGDSVGAQLVISGTAEAGSAVAIHLDDVLLATVTANGSGTWSHTPTAPLSDGTHTVRARATDGAGNTGPFSAYNQFIVDTVAPAKPTVATPGNATYVTTGQPAISGSAEPNATVLISIDGTQLDTTVATGSGSWSFTPGSALAEGGHTVSAVARDAAGNVSEPSDTNAFTVDTVPPAPPQVVTPANGSTVSTATPMILGKAEPASTVEITLDGTAAGEAAVDGAGDWSFVPSASLAEGVHTVSAVARDQAGHRSGSSATNTFAVAFTPLETVINSGPAPVTNATSVSFTFSSPRSGATFECSLDTGAFTPCTSPYTRSGLANGPHTFRVRAVDVLGNPDATPASRSWTVDTVAPAAPTVSAPASGAALATARPTITGGAEAGSTVTITVNGVAVGTAVVDDAGSWTFTLPSSLSDGQHRVSARATDPAGNTGPSSAGRSFVIDTAAPDTNITSSPTGDTRETEVTIVFGSNEAGVTFECSLDGAAFSACSSPVTYTGLSTGAHTFQARARDAAGNVDASPASAGWSVIRAARDGRFMGGGLGCSTAGGESALALLATLGLLSRAARRRGLR